MDLRTRYMGLSLKNPLIASASPLNGDIGNLRGLEDAGAAAVVLPSIFEEQIVGERRGVQAGRAADIDPESYLDLIRRAKEALDIPVIASLNGVSRTGWVDFGRMLQHAGADAIELNIYFIAADLLMTGRELDERYVDVLASVKSAVTIPVAVKIGPYFSAVGAVARALAAAGAAGLVLFNRFYQPDINIKNLGLAMELELSIRDPPATSLDRVAAWPCAHVNRSKYRGRNSGASIQIPAGWCRCRDDDFLVAAPRNYAHEDTARRPRGHPRGTRGDQS